MSRNISREKRENLLAKIRELRTFLESANATPEMRAYLYELESELKRQKFGLVFEEHKEEIDEILETHTPVLTEDKSLFIDNGGTMNFLIEGDNLATLSLLEKTHKGRIDIIYIDPPYNLGANDFTYGDKRVDNNDTFRHSKWLSFMRCRLKIAHKLLRKTGCIFISISDVEQAQLKILCDDVFGYANFCGQIIWNKKSGGGQTDEFFVTEHEYILVYRKTAFFKWTDEIIQASMVGFNGEDERGKFKTVRLAKWGTAARREDRPTMYFPIKNPDGKNTYPIAPDGNEGRWRIGKKRMELNINSDNIHWEKVNGIWVAYEKVYYSDEDVKVLKSRSIYLDMGETGDGSKALTKIFGIKDVFSNPKPIELLSELLSHAKNNIILDFFAGSGTTGHAVMELNQEDGGNRRFILCTNNENGICRDVTYERIKTVITGKRKDGSVYSDSLSASLKYQKIGFIPTAAQAYYDYANELLLHIRELVELENAINFEGNTDLTILLTEDEVDKFFADSKKVNAVKTIYLGHDIALSLEQQKILSDNNIELNIIPEYYYKEQQV